MRTLLDRKNFSCSSNGQVAAHRVTGLIIKRLFISPWTEPVLYSSRLFYFILVTKYNLKKSTCSCNEVHLSCTFENVTKYRYFVICFLALLFLAIIYSIIVDVVYIHDAW